ncbi:hypothetical protein [Methylobacterium mesophilicum]|uniref:hypothetical protein n=1 Tax=Methylobacterium mesophilicum TaxID=39956 RepID=UPI002F35330A
MPVAVGAEAAAGGDGSGTGGAGRPAAHVEARAAEHTVGRTGLGVEGDDEAVGEGAGAGRVAAFRHERADLDARGVRSRLRERLHRAVHDGVDVGDAGSDMDRHNQRFARRLAGGALRHGLEPDGGGLAGPTGLDQEHGGVSGVGGPDLRLGPGAREARRALAQGLDPHHVGCRREPDPAACLKPGLDGEADLLGLLARQGRLAGLDADHRERQVRPAGTGRHGVEERCQRLRGGIGARRRRGEQQRGEEKAPHSVSLARAYWSRARTKTGLKRPSRAPE